MQNEFDELNQEHNTYITKAEHEFELLNQKIETMEKSMKESKENLNKENIKNKNNLDNLNDLFNKERREFR